MCLGITRRASTLLARDFKHAEIAARTQLVVLVFCTASAAITPYEHNTDAHCSSCPVSALLPHADRPPSGPYPRFITAHLSPLPGLTTAPLPQSYMQRSLKFLILSAAKCKPGCPNSCVSAHAGSLLATLLIWVATVLCSNLSYSREQLTDCWLSQFPSYSIQWPQSRSGRLQHQLLIPIFEHIDPKALVARGSWMSRPTMLFTALRGGVEGECGICRLAILRS
jgi:hypothetical protein